MALAATRALGREGVPVAVLAEYPWAPALRSRYCVEAISAPDADRGEPYLAALEAQLQKRRYSGLFFCDDRTAVQVGRQRHRFESLVPFLLPDQELLELAVNKVAMMDFARSRNISLPITVYPSSVDDIGSATRGMSYPVVVKGTGGYASRSLRIAHTDTEARDAFLELDSRQRHEGYHELPHIQEYVSGPIFSALAVCRHGDPRAIFMMRKNRTFPIWGGVSVEAESVYDPVLERVVRHFLAQIPWHGVIEIEYVLDQSRGQYLLIEPSPDPNWGLDLAIAAGMNVPHLAWLLMQGRELSLNQCRYVSGKRFVWFFPEGCQYMLKRPMSIPAMLLAALSPTVGSDLRQLDYGPLVNQLRKTIWTIKAGG